MAPAFQFGIENLIDLDPPWLKTDRLGLVCHPASVNQSLEHSADILHRLVGDRLIALFGPQHGARGEKQDNMIESDDFIDPIIQIPVYSLYGTVRTPSPSMLHGIDTLLIDLQDVGTRIYTFASTMAACMRAAAAKGIQVVVLDRPNPIGGVAVEGNILEDDCHSFVGEFPIPMRHGLTMAELARLFRNEMSTPCTLQVVEMRGWKRSDFWNDLELDWIAPSPNIPSPVSAQVYPGTVIFEATNVSEGRGTTRPFELIGSPYIDGTHLASKMMTLQLPGVCFRPVWFEPTFHKWKGELCSGVQLHIRDPWSFKPYVTGLMLLETIRSEWPDQFRFTDPPYEYEWDRRPIDLIVGSRTLMDELEQSGSEIADRWQEELAAYQEQRTAVLLY